MNKTKELLLKIRESVAEGRLSVEEVPMADVKQCVYSELKANSNTFAEQQYLDVMNRLHIISENFSKEEKDKNKLLLLLDAFILCVDMVSQSVYKLANGDYWRYKHHMEMEDPEVSQIIEHIDSENRIDVFNYDFVKEYDTLQAAIYMDEACGMKYVPYKGRKMFFPKGWTEEEIDRYYRSVMIEQDRRSPHCYNNENCGIQAGDVVVDAGTAEGIFALDCVDKASRLYLIETDEGWIEALEHTFCADKNKVHIIHGFLGNVDEGNCVSIDGLFAQEEINYIKMDIEGAEKSALQGASKTLERCGDIRCAICSYHCKEDEQFISSFLKDHGFQTETSKGYMSPNWTIDAYLDAELRRGVVFGKKECSVVNRKKEIIGAVCFNGQDNPRELSFAEILLDETLVRGDVWIRREALCSVGGINYRLGAKRVYELLVRIAEKYKVVQIGEKAGEDTASGADFFGEKECSKEDWLYMGTAEDTAGTEAGEDEALKTDCYLIGRYKTELLSMGCFDDVVLGILSSGKESVIRYLEQMIAGTKEFWDIYDCTQPILIYTGCDVCYNILDVFAQGLGEALEERGQRVEYFDISTQPIEELEAYIKRRFKAVIGMQTYMFSVRRKGGRFVHDEIEAPKYHFVFDHPIKLREHLEQVPKGLCVLTPDGNYAEFVREYYGNPARFLPPAGRKTFLSGTEEGTGRNERTPFSAEKDYDVSFLGSYCCGPIADLKAARNTDRKRCYLLNRYILYMRRDLSMTPEQALKQALEYYGITCSKEEFVEIMYREWRAFCCLAFHYRNKVIKALLESGIRLHVFGDTWKDSPMWGHPGLICHEAAIGDEALAVYARSKVSLNVMTWHKDGFTERIANAMLQKAVVVTDRTTFLEKSFVDEEDLLMFDLNHIQELPDRVKKLLDDEDKRKRIAENGYKKAARQHTWEQRAEQILEMIESGR